MAEWLGKALQKPVRGFESLWYLKKPAFQAGFLFMGYPSIMMFVK
jgi:hypothetical protein